MSRILTVSLASTFLMCSSLAARADLNVVASTKPVHSLVAAVMQGTGEPALIIDGAGSPHNYALKPSQARMLESADVIFWIGESLELFLEKPLVTIGAGAKSVALINADDLVKLEIRDGEAFEKHAHDDHDDHDHDDHDDHADHHDHDDHDDHGEHADHKDDKDHDDHAGHDDHDHGHDQDALDAHIWLDPQNAKAMVREIEKVLVAADPANTARYETNADATIAKLDGLIGEITAQLEPLSDKGFIVFHDAYQYFERRFGLTASGSITVSPDVMPGAARLSEIRTQVKNTGVSCVFAEPQFEPKLVSTVIENTPVLSGVIDPIGAELDNGPALYFDLIRNMATSFETCLSASS